MPYKDKEQERLYKRLYNQKNKVRFQTLQNQRRQEKKTIVLTHYSLGNIAQCSQCRETDIDVLCIDHINGEGTQHRKRLGLCTGNGFYSWLKQHNFPEGYQTLCANCNLKKEILRRKIGGLNGSWKLDFY